MKGESRTIEIRGDLDIVTARSVVREIARDQGFPPVDQARLATVVSELARNISLYADSGNVIIGGIERDGYKGVEIICEDQGPGIEDLELAMQEEYSTSGGRGMGLPGAKRLMDAFTIQSTVGVGTKIISYKLCRPADRETKKP